MHFIYFIFAIVFIVCVEKYHANKRMMETRKRLKEGWGKLSSKEIPLEEFLLLEKNFNKKSNESLNISDIVSVIDDITWNDLDMDRVFRMINQTHSSVGREYLYKLLRTPVSDKEELRRRDTLINEISNDEDGRLKLQQLFSKVGFCHRRTLTNYLGYLKEAVSDSNIKHYICNIAFIAALCFMLFIDAGMGMLFLFIVLGYNILTYYRYKADIEPFYVCIRYVASMSDCAAKMASLKLSYLEQPRLDSFGHIFDKDKRRLKYISSGSDYTGSIMDSLFDYVRMITHIDIIMYNRIILDFQNKQNDIDDMTEYLGYIESMIAVASFRTYLSYWTRPQFTMTQHGFIKAEDMYHPLISEPVSNSIDTAGCVLITGSNASGKSTFLKTMAINALLAQTICTCTAKSYSSSYFRIFSSMSLRDDLQSGESYYMVEIKAIRRILDSCMGVVPVLCFVDEVLRGTNTVERIAASTQILLNLKKNNALCFAATHDIELTRLLEKDYTNYHFEEKVEDDDISFQFRLLSGPATTRNAIRLLKSLNYDSSIVENADRMAAEFMKTGNWVLD